MILCCLRCTLQPSATGNKLVSKRYQHFREHGLPYGLHDSLCTLHLFCSTQKASLRHRRNTRYGWMANPYPTGTFTLQDAPSFAWRANVELCGRETKPQSSFKKKVKSYCSAGLRKKPWLFPVPHQRFVGIGSPYY